MESMALATRSLWLQGIRGAYRSRVAFVKFPRYHKYATALPGFLQTFHHEDEAFACRFHTLRIFVHVSEQSELRCHQCVHSSRPH